MLRLDGERTPGSKLALAIGLAFLLSIPLFSIYLLNYGRQSESREATQSITSGWGGPQTIGEPVLVIPYKTTTSSTAVENGQSVTRTTQVARQLTLAPEAVELATELSPQLRSRSIYEAVIYQAAVSGKARFTLPPDLARSGVDPAQMDLSHAELRFAVSDPRGLGSNPKVSAGGMPLRLQPGGGSNGGGGGFFGWTDASGLAGKPLVVDFAYDIRGNEALSLAPLAGDTRWSVRSSWASPSFGGDFLPGARRVGDQGFEATYRIGNLALGRSLIATGDAAPPADEATGRCGELSRVQGASRRDRADAVGRRLFAGRPLDEVRLPVHRLHVPRAADVRRDRRSARVERRISADGRGAGAVLRVASRVRGGHRLHAGLCRRGGGDRGTEHRLFGGGAGSWRRAGFIGALLAGLYAVLYVLISLEAYSLLIGSLLLFAALAGVMYATRRIDWGARAEAAA